MKIRRIDATKTESYVSISATRFDDDGELCISIGEYDDGKLESLCTYVNRVGAMKLRDKLTALLESDRVPEIATYTIEE